MRFLWPGALALLGLIPLLVGFYIWRLRRRRPDALRYSSLSLVRAALPQQSRLRRYLPPALALAALGLLAFSLARPVTITLVPAGRATIILALDVSGSMRQDDIWPSRLSAAKEAALGFIDRQRGSNQIGVVAFAGFAQLVQPPSTDPEELATAIELLTTGRGTAIGSGIEASLEAITEFNQSAAARPSLTQEPSAGERAYQPDIIVLLTDGVYTTGTHPLVAAQRAAESGVRVYTIGYGTPQGGNMPGNPYFGRRGFRRGIDENTLREIASMTGGEYFSAGSASELQSVFDSLPTFLVTREETSEVSVHFAAAAALFLALALLLAQLWQALP